MTKVLGLDVGSKTIGVAISDDFGWTAQGLTTIHWKEPEYKSVEDTFKQLIDEYTIEKVVIGLPKNMNGSIGFRGEASQDFAKFLVDTFSVDVVMWDERLTTMAAEKVLLEADMSRAKRKKVIDKMAAVMILQGYLDSQS
ncbi:Holliday junction resolvase [Gracilibacillus boraciitolerans JCM 21714]|uniref:Putative pre-16S rRNA nuclease n=1 Tax=Gracilibacillus boraciitolerans JCM 21714 TaxID=1298598 RepID=W4VMY2_9BACI|nr:Holliday junction resolvase RuvX [Gracilibacillus boraciitolerans]GAE94109.1 Holliday junction resolvase [Gracilibacillus boraciitolerans JCM 21714]